MARLYVEELRAAGYHLPPVGCTEEWSTIDAYAYRTPAGMVVGFNKGVYPFWRNLPNKAGA